MARLTVNSGKPDETVFCVAKITVAVDVTVFLVLSISFEIDTKEAVRVRGPLPEAALPDAL
jgi:hypothetical protein